MSLKLLNKIKPSIIISYNYKYIIEPRITKRYNIINLHISYLPYNRGANPNIWSHIDNTPSGVTIHLIDEHIDTGNIIVQKKVILDQQLTLRESYKILHTQIQRLFKRNFHIFFNLKRKKLQSQKNKKGSIHYTKESFLLDNGYSTTIQRLMELNR